MRSISFGPTSYLEDSRQYIEEDDGQNTHISNESVGNSYSSSQRGVNEVIFYASENLFREGFTSGGGAGSHHRELAMKKYCKCKFAFDSQRTFQSFCFEFCGLLNIRMNDVRFYLGNRETPLSRQVKKPCIIEVQSSHGSSGNGSRSGPQSPIRGVQQGNNCLQQAIRELLDKGLYSDIEIVVNGEVDSTIRAHKAILMARSEKFKAMIESTMRESRINKVEINDSDITVATYRLLVQWIYEGECDLTGSTIPEMLALLKLSDEYLLADLQRVCEDNIIDTMDGAGALHILTDMKILLPATSDQLVKDAAKTVLLDEYEAVEKQIPDIEERISNVKGLMSDLFTHKLKKKKSGMSRGRNRKGSIIIDEGGSKKKVRFNISSTIYEEASAINHDESDSMIEPLSIYSNNSPPGELNDELMGGVASSTRSLSIPTTVERRNSEGIRSSNLHLNASMNEEDNNGIQHHNTLDPELDEQDHETTSRVRFNLLRPASAGRNDTNFSVSNSSLRRSQSYLLESTANHSAGGDESSSHQAVVLGESGIQRSTRGGHISQSLLM